jgi:hypothetical protein
MSYSLGQAKLVPGQIAFQTTPTGRLPNVQRLLEAGLPYAPYIEHGSWVTGRPDIARYGRDPYRGLGDSPAEIACQASGGRLVTEGSSQRCVGGTREVVETTIAETIRATLTPAVLIGTGATVGLASGIAGALLGKTLVGGLVGAVGGGVLGYLAWQAISPRAPEPAPSAVAGLSGILAVV